jgi:hypothetical protein
VVGGLRGYVPRHAIGSRDGGPPPTVVDDNDDGLDRLNLSRDASRHSAGSRRRGGTRSGTRHSASSRRRRRRTSLPIVLALVVVTVVSGLVSTVVLVGDPPVRHETVAADPAGPSGIPVVERPARPEGAPAVAELPPSPPIGVEIPSIGVSSGLEPLGLQDDGTMEAPDDFDLAGWFTVGPQPGQSGPAVIAGHVDSRDGPAVFYHLGDLAAGDEVLVQREDGTTVGFQVTGIETYPKDAFPSTAVYGPVLGPELRLITCDGVFDRSSHEYRDNLVVYATALAS